MTTTMNSSLLLLAAAAAVVVCTFAPSPAAADPYLCTWRTVAHPEDPFIQSLGKWALDQKIAVSRFDKVESAKAQGVGRCTSETRNYELIIDASIRFGDEDYKYKAVVYVTNFTHPQELISFAAIRPPYSPPPPANN